MRAPVFGGCHVSTSRDAACRDCLPSHAAPGATSCSCSTLGLLYCFFEASGCSDQVMPWALPMRRGGIPREAALWALFLSS